MAEGWHVRAVVGVCTGWGQFFTRRCWLQRSVHASATVMLSTVMLFALQARCSVGQAWHVAASTPLAPR